MLVLLGGTSSGEASSSHSPIWSAKFIRGEGGGEGLGKKDMVYLYKAFIVTLSGGQLTRSLPPDVDPY